MQIGNWSSPSARVLADLLLGLGIEVDVGGAVDAAWRPPRSCPGSVRRPRRACGTRWAARTRRRPRRRGRPRRSPPLAKPSLASARERAGLERQALDELDLLVGVARAAVDRDDARQPELLDDAEVAAHVGHAGLDRRAPAGAVDARVVLDAAVVLDRAHGGDEHDGARAQPAEAADDVEELLHAHVRAEARLGHHVVAELHADQVGDERVVAVGDVRERAAVHQARLALERLDQVRLERVLEQHGHRAGGAEVLGGDRLAAVERVRDGDARRAAGAGPAGRARRP